MLTKSDLQQMGNLVEEIVDRKITERVGSIVDNRLNKKLSPIKKELKKIRNDQKTMFDYLDREQRKQEKRIVRLEKCIGITV